MPDQNDEIIKQLQEKNKKYQHEYKDIFAQHVEGQSPKIVILTCADSRVIPELIFNSSIGDIFVVRIAGNISIDETVIASLEYAVNHINISHLIILGHTHCGAVKAAEETQGSESLLLKEIQDSFCLDESNHVNANLTRQHTLLPKRSKSIQDAIENGSLKLISALYHLNDGHVEFL